MITFVISTVMFITVFGIVLGACHDSLGSFWLSDFGGDLREVVLNLIDRVRKLHKRAWHVLHRELGSPLREEFFEGAGFRALFLGGMVADLCVRLPITCSILGGAHARCAVLKMLGISRAEVIDSTDDSEESDGSGDQEHPGRDRKYG